MRGQVRWGGRRYGSIAGDWCGTVGHSRARQGQAKQGCCAQAARPQCRPGLAEPRSPPSRGPASFDKASKPLVCPPSQAHGAASSTARRAPDAAADLARPLAPQPLQEAPTHGTHSPADSTCRHFALGSIPAQQTERRIVSWRKNGCPRSNAIFTFTRRNCVKRQSSTNRGNTMKYLQHTMFMIESSVINDSHLIKMGRNVINIPFIDTIRTFHIHFI